MVLVVEVEMLEGEEYCVVCGTTRGGFDEGGAEY